MRRVVVIWVAIFVLYGAFLLWYEGGGSPLSDAEVENFVALMKEQGDIEPERIATLREFLANDDGGDFVMANFIRLRNAPLLVGDVRRGESAQETLDRYMAHMMPALLRRACHPVAVGPVLSNALDVWGIEGGADWSMVGLVRYRSRRDMMEIATAPAFGEAHLYKQAAMSRTIAVPFEPILLLGDPRWLVALVLLAIGGLLHGLSGRGTAPAPR